MTLASSHPVRIQICGPLAVERDGQRLDAGLPGRQGRLLFTYLVVNRHRQIPATSWPRRCGANPIPPRSTPGSTRCCPSCAGSSAPTPLTGAPRPAVPARRLGRPGSRRRGHPPGRILGRPAGLGAGVGAGAHRAVRGRARIPSRRGRALDRRDPPPADGTAPARPGVLRGRRTGPRRDRTRRRGPGRPAAHPRWLRCGKAATATSCRPSPRRTTWPKPSAFTASSASACATSSASHPARPPASSTNAFSPQPEW